MAGAKKKALIAESEARVAGEETAESAETVAAAAGATVIAAGGEPTGRIAGNLRAPLKAILTGRKGPSAKLGRRLLRWMKIQSATSAAPENLRRLWRMPGPCMKMMTAWMITLAIGSTARPLLGTWA
jgi:hypothetical protein